MQISYSIKNDSPVNHYLSTATWIGSVVDRTTLHELKQLNTMFSMYNFDSLQSVEEDHDRDRQKPKYDKIDRSFIDGNGAKNASTQHQTDVSINASHNKAEMNTEHIVVS